jgi:nucleotide-binding universal stress UspA family protein
LKWYETCPTKEGDNAMFKNILVAFKFSKGGLLALETGAQLAREQEADLHIFHALDYHLQRLDPSDPAIEENKAQCERRFHDEAMSHTEGISQVSFDCLPADPAMGVLTTAKKRKADLIVLGEHHASSAMSLGRLDYVGMTVVEKAPCPVMIVPFRSI